MPFSAQHIRAARNQLRKNDPVMKQIIARIGPFTLKTEPDRFRCLVKSIVAQQISRDAARTVLARLEQQVSPPGLSPEGIQHLDESTLQSAGLSRQKTSYLLSLAQLCSDGTIDLAGMGRKRDEQVIDELVQVKGIGVWTAQMFLIFGLGRLDVLPTGDLAIQTSIKNQYGLRNLPSVKRMETLAKPWRPYATVASWYLWRSHKPE